MSKFSFTRRILLDYPGIFSLGFVTKESPNEKSNEFPFSFELYGVGWPAGTDIEQEPPTKEVVAKVKSVLNITETEQKLFLSLIVSFCIETYE